MAAAGHPLLTESIDPCNEPVNGKNTMRFGSISSISATICAFWDERVLAGLEATGVPVLVKN